ncbi:MAG: iron-sulfur cluster assembly accessory protein [Acidobacteria bacterium]|nr:iron-sulfur cluster assembly accessory protein [Acidobacteriota bacterium]
MRRMLTITELAQKKVAEAMKDEERDDLALRIAIAGRTGGGFRYQMDLVGLDEARPGDEILDTEAFKVYVDSESAPDLDGATIDFVTRLSESGFKFDNPNSVWGDGVAADVQRVLDEQINPQIAAHGGFVTLLEVKDETAYITMGGGCQGCGMADYTLKQGVEQAIVEAVPAVQRVLDTTDHAAGTNPYYAP